MTLFLASQSPRRRELLTQMGVVFDVLDVSIDETPAAGEPALDYVRRVAREKAGAGLIQVAAVPGALVLGADLCQLYLADANDPTLLHPAAAYHPDGAAHENTARALRLLIHPDGMDLSSRRVTVSTSGLVPEIERLGAEFRGEIALAVSLHAPDDELHIDPRVASLRPAGLLVSVHHVDADAPAADTGHQGAQRGRGATAAADHLAQIVRMHMHLDGAAAPVGHQVDPHIVGVVDDAANQMLDGVDDDGADLVGKLVERWIVEPAEVRGAVDVVQEHEGEAPPPLGQEPNL